MASTAATSATIEAPTRWWRPPATDVLLAVVMAAYSFYDVVHGSWTGPVPVNAVVVCGMTLSLAFRRRLPLVVLAIVGTSIVMLGVSYGSAQAWSSVFPFVIAAYSAAAYSEHVLASVVLIAATVVLRDLNDPMVTSLSDSLFSSTLAVLTILAGLEGRHLHVRRARLDDRAEALRLEEERLTAEAAADERRRIARELHDIISHSLGVIVLQAGAADQVLDNDPQKAHEVLGSIRSIGNEAIGELGALLGLVREGVEPSREPQPCLGDLPALVDQAIDGGMAVTLEVDRGTTALSPALELSAYRIVQEALTNARKHAPGANVSVRVTIDDHDLRVLVDDDAVPTAHAPGGRRGLAGMAERVTVFGGELRAGPKAGRGWSVDATLPVIR